MRHGEAEASAASGDAARRLTARGEDAVRAAAKVLRRLRAVPDAIWHSPYARAEQTAVLVGQALGVGPLTPMPDLVPHGPAVGVADRIFQASARRLLVVSHLPLLPSVCAELLGVDLRIDFGTASVVELTVLGGAAARGCAVLSSFFPSKALTELA